MLTKFPKEVTLDAYQKSIDEMVGVLSQYDGVHTIFQVGGLSSPGISDIDFFVVFEDEARCHHQPLDAISQESRYLFTHGLFGTSKKYASKTEQYTLFGNYKKLWGHDFDMHLHVAADPAPIKLQLAFEYLIKMYITQKIEQRYRIHGVRNFLLLAKAIKMDLGLLSINSGPLLELCNEVLEIRENWFRSTLPKNSQIEKLISSFNEALEDLLCQLLQEHSVYLPSSFKGKIARNLTLMNGKELLTRSKGFNLPPRLGMAVFGPKFPRLLNRLVDFVFEVPFTNEEIPKEVGKRFQVLSEAVTYNHRRLPNFSATGYPLNIF